MPETLLAADELRGRQTLLRRREVMRMGQFTNSAISPSRTRASLFRVPTSGSDATAEIRAARYDGAEHRPRSVPHGLLARRYTSEAARHARRGGMSPCAADEARRAMERELRRRMAVTEDNRRKRK